MSSVPAYAWALLWPRRIEENLRRAHEAGLVAEVPTLWQVVLGVARMWHRVLFRPQTIGTSQSHPVRSTLRARLLSSRPLRFPFLVMERAIAPLDFSGLASSEERILRHLLGAHHDGSQFVYDLELLSIHPGALEELRGRARAVVEEDTPRSRWLRDLTVFERYHESLLAAVERACAEGIELAPEDASNPDISLSAYLAWCLRQPRTPAETWAAMQRGAFSIADGVRLPEAA